MPLVSSLLSTYITPYLLPIALVGLIASHAGAFFYGVNVGGTRQELACEQRVGDIKKQIEDKNAEIAAINSLWQTAIDKVQENYNKQLLDAEQKNVELDSKVTLYEMQINNTDCRPIDDRDLDSLR